MFDKVKTLLICISAAAMGSCGSSRTDDPINAPTAPAKLEAYVTSLSSVRLFWESATDNIEVTGYEVYRNDDQLIAALPLTQYVDNTVEASISYQYRVIALDNEGNRGPAATIDLSIPASAPLIDTDSYVDIVRFVLSLFVGNGYRTDITDMIRYTRANEPVSIDIISDVPGEYHAVSDYLCSNDGTVQVEEIRGALGGQTTVDFINCDWEDRVWTGHATVYSSTGTDMYDVQQLTIIDRDGLQFDTTGRFGFTDYLCSGDGDKNWRANANSLVAERRNGDLLISNIDTEFSYGNSCGLDEYSTLSGSFIARSPTTLDRPLVVSTPVPFENNAGNDRYFPTGQLLIDAGEGNQLLLNADTNDLLTTTMILALDGENYVFDELWDTWIDVLTLTEQ